MVMKAGMGGTDEEVYQAITKEGQGGTQFGGLPPGPTETAAPTAAAVESQGQGKIQDNAYFRTLDREVQKFIEQSGDPFGTLQGIQSGTISPPGAKAGTGGPPEQAPAVPAAPGPGGPVQQPTAPITPPAGPSSAGSAQVRLGEGVSDVPGTFTRPGERAFQPFQGRAFGHDLKDTQGASARDVLEGLAQRSGLRTGAIGRMPVAGVSGGISTAGEALGGLGRGADDDALTAAVLRQQGLG
jgi:hypothetical protein